jgi:glycerophosphoryl diester phosphodiesterase
MRPFYAIAHHSNLVSDLRGALEAGANAIECDVEWDERAWVRHPAALKEPLPSGTPLDEYLHVLKSEAKLHAHLSLVIFDIKPTMQRDHVTDLFTRARAELATSGVNVALTVPENERLAVFADIVPRLDRSMAIGVDEEDDPERVRACLRGAGVPLGCYGNGIDSSIPHLTSGSMEAAVRRAVELRDAEQAFSLVYRWTLNTRASMRAYLDLGVDGIMTDHLGDLLALLRESPYREAFRLAGRGDAPFAG